MILLSTVCIFVIGLNHTAVCESSEHAYPVGICQAIENETVYCTATMDEFYGRLQPYHPELGGINCFEDTCDYLAGGTPTATAYNYALACPQGMFQEYIQFDYTDDKIWQCLDHGGAIHLRSST